MNTLMDPMHIDGREGDEGSQEDAFGRYLYRDEVESSFPLNLDEPVSTNTVPLPHLLHVGVDLERHPSGCVPIVHNMTGTCNLGCQVDLEKLTCSTRNTEYNPEGLPGAIMRLVEPKSVAIVFSSGKMVIMGTPTEKTLKLAARKIAKIIKLVGFSVQFHSFSVVNILATCDTRFPIRIEGISFKHALCSYYEPEIFPGLIYRMKQPKVTLLVFVSGKVVLVGAKNYDHLVQAFETLYPSLREFRKPDAYLEDAPSDGIHSLDAASLHRLLLETHDP